MLPFVSQTTYNLNKTVKFRFIMYPQDKWVEYIKQGLIGDYINDCFDYISNRSEKWFSMRIKKSKEDRFIYLDNRSKNIGYDEIPRFFIEEQIINDKNCYDVFLSYFIKGFKLDLDNIEFIPYHREEMIDIYTKSE